jgi:hypothetical protein
MQIGRETGNVAHQCVVCRFHVEQSMAWGLVARIFVSTNELEAAAEQLRLLVRPFTDQSQVTNNEKIRR